MANDKKAPAADAHVGELFGFDSKRTVFSLEGPAIFTRMLDSFELPLVADRSRRPAKQFSIPLFTGGARSFTLPFGMTVISGATSSGKSSLLRGLKAAGAPISVYRAAEPHDGPADLAEPFFPDADTALAYAIHDYWHEFDRGVIIGIDSLRAPLFETRGAATSKGVIAPFFTAITRVSEQLASCGYTVIATVNPMDDDAEFTKAFLQRLSASVACYIEVRSSKRSGTDVAIQGVVSVRPDRRPEAFSFESTANVKLPTPKEIQLPAVAVFRDVGRTPHAVISSLQPSS